jgi:hypothetical protein
MEEFVMETRIYNYILRMFTSDDIRRPSLTKPFKQSGFYFATDAHSMIYFPVDLVQLDVDEDPQAPNCISVIPDIMHSPIEWPVSILNDIIKSKVPTIQEAETCNICGGDGKQECDLGHTHPCSGCGGDGKWPKRNGKMIPNPNSVLVFNGNIGYKVKEIVRLIEASKRLGVDTVIKVSGIEHKAGLFRVGSATILIMSCWLGDEDDNIVKVNELSA